VYRGMRRITLAVVAVLLAVPTLAQAKVGIEFDNAIETQKPGDRQSFSVLVMNEPPGPGRVQPKAIAGVRPLISFRNERTGDVVRVRGSRTSSEGIGRGSVVLADRGPWTVYVRAAGLSQLEGQTFEVGPPTEAKVVATFPPPPDPAPVSDDDGGGLPAWLLSFPAAALAAFGIWRLRRRPRELGA
jgi:hypothetical protein